MAKAKKTRGGAKAAAGRQAKARKTPPASASAPARKPAPSARAAAPARKPAAAKARAPARKPAAAKARAPVRTPPKPRKSRAATPGAAGPDQNKKGLLSQAAGWLKSTFGNLVNREPEGAPPPSEPPATRSGPRDPTLQIQERDIVSEKAAPDASPPPPPKPR